MIRPYYSVYAQCLYRLGLGLPFIFAPNFVLTLLTLPPTQEVWIRLLGLLAVVAASYYFAAAESDARAVLRATVRGRLVFSAGLVVLVAVGAASRIMLPFALFEVGTAVGTWAELRRHVAVA